MNEWTRPVSEYRGEFKWSYKEGFSREGRREKEVDRLSVDLKQLRFAKKREKEAAVANSESNPDVHKTKQPAVIVDTNGDEYDVCETAKEALERLIKGDHRLASKYHNHVKKLDARLKPYGTSYQSSFMKSANLFPSARAYEMAAEEFEKNQDVLETHVKNRNPKVHPSKEWESSLANYGKVKGPLQDVTQGRSSHVHFHLQEDEPDQQNKEELEDTDLMRQKWVDTAHKELSRSFRVNQQTTDDSRERSRDIVPLWLRRGLQRQGLI